MEYVKLGNTGLNVSPICLGCMSFGSAEGWVHNPWALGEQDSRSIIKRGLDLRINFFDTANVYAYGNSEEILGRALKEYANRDEVVIATKVFSKMRESPNGAGLSRKAILSEIEHSLKRPNTDYVDLYIIHRWDYNTPTWPPWLFMSSRQKMIATRPPHRAFWNHFAGNGRLVWRVCGKGRYQTCFAPPAIQSSVN